MCDDITTIYYDGVAQDPIPGTDNWNKSAISEIPTSTKEVMIKCVNPLTEYANGIKAQILNGAGKIVSQTGKSWQCSTNANSGFKPATIEELMHTDWGSKGGPGSVIWTSSTEDDTAYCKTTISGR